MINGLSPYSRPVLIVSAKSEAMGSKMNESLFEVRVVPSFPTYGVTKEGRVWSYKRGSFRTIRKDRNGYWGLILYSPGGYQHRLVHQLVLEAWVGPRPEGQVCRHLDGDRDNNHIDNLAYGTYRDNTADAMRHGTQHIAPPGMSHPACKLTDEQVLELVSLYRHGLANQSHLAKQFAVSQSQVSRLVRGKERRYLRPLSLE